MSVTLSLNAQKHCMKCKISTGVSFLFFGHTGKIFPPWLLKGLGDAATDSFCLSARIGRHHKSHTCRECSWCRVYSISGKRFHLAMGFLYLVRHLGCVWGWTTVADGLHHQALHLLLCGKQLWSETTSPEPPASPRFLRLWPCSTSSAPAHMISQDAGYLKENSIHILWFHSVAFPEQT